MLLLCYCYNVIVMLCYCYLCLLLLLLNLKYLTLSSRHEPCEIYTPLRYLKHMHLLLQYDQGCVRHVVSIINTIMVKPLSHVGSVDYGRLKIILWFSLSKQSLFWFCLHDRSAGATQVFLAPLYIIQDVITHLQLVTAGDITF